MATKPATTPRVWASSGIYTTGPFIGSPSVADPGIGIAAEGHRPGSSFPTAAEHENSQQFELTTWVATWLALGSSAGAADAHILETDSAGRFGAVGATLVDAVDETCLDITAANTFAPAVNVTSAATAYQASMGNGAGTGFSAPIGTGAGVGFTSFMSGTAAGGAGLTIDADNASAADCVRLTHDGSGVACLITATGTGFALDVVGSSAALYGARFVGGGLTSLLAEGVGGANGAIVQSGTTAGGIALSSVLRNNTGSALTLSTPGGSTTAARGLLSSVSGSAAAAEFVSPNYYAAIFTGDTTAPTFGPVVITESNAVPTSPLPNQIARVRSAFGVSPQLMESCLEDFPGTNGWRGLLSTTGGSALGQGYAAGPFTTAFVGSWYNTVSVTASNGNAPKTASRQILMRVNFSWRNTGAATLGVRIIDVTADPGAASPVFQRTGAGTGATAGYALAASADWSVPITLFVPVTVPAVGNRTWRLDILSSGAGLIVVRDVSMDFLGML